MNMLYYYVTFAYCTCSMCCHHCGHMHVREQHNVICNGSWKTSVPDMLETQSMHECSSICCYVLLEPCVQDCRCMLGDNRREVLGLIA